MARWFMAVLFTIVTSNCLLAQQNNLEIRGKETSLFIEHKVAPKESFYSVGRLYNVQPKALASYNNLQFGSGLSIGQELKIPLDENNFTQTESKTNEEVLVPVYHEVEPKETLYRLSINYNKVPLASLKKWNHLQSDELGVGSQMIVGYLKVDRSQSSLADQSIIPVKEVAEVHEQKPVEKKSDIIADPTPVAKSSEPEIAKKDEIVTPQINVNNKSTINYSGGYFKKIYDQQIEIESPVSNNGSAGVFKSTSGWQDGKYYCFNNTVPPGTVLKITVNTTGKSVYAKVLDAIPDIKQNEGLSVVISNAAAEELGVGESKFDCVLSY
ncbi:MAG: LysM peptidoglycan-binding domain-containing protein [Bacteroidota bacterium]|nr:LysM peptidoglycan-binding domain-containing protein [Bacteroidota bacterium]